MGMYNTIPMMGAANQVQQPIDNPGVVEQITPRPQTPINPKAFSNQNAIGAMFGQQVNGTPFMQMTSQGYVPPMDPTNPSANPAIDALVTGNTGQPLQPPTGVQQGGTTPYYDLSN